MMRELPGLLAVGGLALLLSSMVTVAAATTFSTVGTCVEALGLHELTTLTVLVPMVLGTRIVVHDWCCASRTTHRALAHVHIYCIRTLCTTDGRF